MKKVNIFIRLYRFFNISYRTRIEHAKEAEIKRTLDWISYYKNFIKSNVYCDNVPKWKTFVSGRISDLEFRLKFEIPKTYERIKYNYIHCYDLM